MGVGGGGRDTSVKRFGLIEEDVLDEQHCCKGYGDQLQVKRKVRWLLCDECTTQQHGSKNEWCSN